MTQGPEAEETATFVEKFDKFFDCLNVSSLSAGKLNRNAFKSPYHSARDFRLKVGPILQIISNLQLFVVITLQWLEEDFMMYLNNWEQSVKGRPGFKASEMKKMLLSSETRLGLSITGAIMFQ